MWDTTEATKHSKAGNLLPLGNPSPESLKPSGQQGGPKQPAAAVPRGSLCLLWLKPAGTGAGGYVLGVVLTPHAAFKEITAMLVNLALSRGRQGKGCPFCSSLWFRTRNLTRFYCLLKLLQSSSRNCTQESLCCLRATCFCCSVQKFLRPPACPPLAYLIVASPLVLDTRSNSFVASQFSGAIQKLVSLNEFFHNLFSKGLQSLISLTFLFNYFSSLCHSSGLRPSYSVYRSHYFGWSECPAFCTPGLRLAGLMSLLLDPCDVERNMFG